MDYYSGPAPKIIGATVYALNRTFGLAPAREHGTHETVTEVIDSRTGLIRTDQGNIYSNGDFNVVKFR